MRSVRYILIACLVIPIACGARSEEPKAANEQKNTSITPQEYEIYSAILDDLGEGSIERPVSQLVVQQTPSTGVPPGWGGLTPVQGWQGLKQVFPENLLLAFQKQNQNDAATISAHDLKCKKKCVLVKQDKLIAFFKDRRKDARKGWKDFYKRYPGAFGITFLSRVGFDNTGDSALVYEGTMMNIVGGAGYFILLEKMKGVWTIKDQQMVWIS